jgi:hypothetical protein
LRRYGQLCAEAVEDLFEGRHNPHEQGGRYRHGEQQDGERVGKCGPHPRALGGGALAVVGKPREYRCQCPGRFAHGDELTIERVELRRMPFERGRKTQPCRDVARERADDSRHAVPAWSTGLAGRGLRQQIQGRSERQPGAQEAGELAGEQRDLGGACFRAGRGAAHDEFVREQIVALEHRAGDRCIGCDDRATFSNAVAVDCAPREA